MNRTKTNIVQAYSNLTALLVTLDVLRACFGKDIEFRQSKTHQQDSKDLKYEMGIWEKIPMKKLGKDATENFSAFVRFTLEEINSRLRLDGYAKVQIMGWSQILEVLSIADVTGVTYCVAEGSELSLKQFKIKLFEHCRQQILCENALRRLKVK